MPTFRWTRNSCILLLRLWSGRGEGGRAGAFALEPVQAHLADRPHHVLQLTRHPAEVRTEVLHRVEPGLLFDLQADQDRLQMAGNAAWLILAHLPARPIQQGEIILQEEIQEAFAGFRALQRAEPIRRESCAGASGRCSGRLAGNRPEPRETVPMS